MTAVIVVLAEWRDRVAHASSDWRARLGRAYARKMASRPVPRPIDVAFDHISWLIRAYPGVHPRTAALMLGLELEADSWARVIEAYAAAWEALPEDVRRQAD